MHYPQPGSYIRDEVKVVLDLSNYVTKERIMLLQVLIQLI